MRGQCWGGASGRGRGGRTSHFCVANPFAHHPTLSSESQCECAACRLAEAGNHVCEEEASTRLPAASPRAPSAPPQPISLPHAPPPPAVRTPTACRRRPHASSRRSAASTRATHSQTARV